MSFKHTILLLGIIISGTFAEGSDGKDVVNLVKDSFDSEVAKMPHFVMFFVPW